MNSWAASMDFRAFSIAIVLGLGCATVDSVRFCDSEVELPVATQACQAEPGVQRMAEELAELIDAEAGPFLIQVEFDDIGGVGSMCAQRSPHTNPWRPRKLLAEKQEEILAVVPGSECLGGSRLDFNWSGAMWAEIYLEQDKCSSEAQPGIDPTMPGRIEQEQAARRYRRCIEHTQMLRGEIWGGRTQNGRPWGLIPGHFYARSEEGKERATAIRACTTNTTSPSRASNDAAIQQVIVNLDEVEDCMRTQGWERLF
ncbi:MAG: hypothetical protein JRE71_01150 [Deltaproteobacteria bacterium]|nr:hypothetical protein [Deltaproteobacteria bacterium]